MVEPAFPAVLRTFEYFTVGVVEYFFGDLVPFACFELIGAVDE
jgi:hypothetical protein